MRYAPCFGGMNGIGVWLRSTLGVLAVSGDGVQVAEDGVLYTTGLDSTLLVLNVLHRLPVLTNVV